MTFGTHLTSKPIRFQEIDEGNRSNHTRLLDSDRCLYLYEKTSHRDYSFSATNNLISNLKKPVTSSAGVLTYKKRAIKTCADAFREALNTQWLELATLVPIPPSKARTNPAFDDRMEQICWKIREEQDVRNLVVQNATMVANHARGTDDRVTVQELLDVYEIDEAQASPAPTHIGIVDDMLTAGTHYRAMHTILSKRFPDAQIVGLFVARRIFPDDD
jgi:predicted amidophosphoribosyltransferase